VLAEGFKTTALALNKAYRRRRYMNKIIICLLALTVVFISGVKSSAEELKIGYVDFFEVYNEYGKTKDYEKKLAEKKEVEEKKLDKKKSEIEKMQSKQNLLKDEERQKEQEKIMKAVKEYKELEWQIFTDLKKERDEKRKELIEDITNIIQEYAKDKGFDLILYKNAILYGHKSIDLTSEILKLVNRRYKGK
jgi:outer membrane protein